MVPTFLCSLVVVDMDYDLSSNIPHGTRGLLAQNKQHQKCRLSKPRSVLVQLEFYVRRGRSARWLYYNTYVCVCMCVRTFAFKMNQKVPT